MAWWSRGSRRNPKAESSACNVLVLSDIHLGEDILVEGPQVLNSYIRALNGTMMGFLRGHQDLRENGKPWHLVINGDMFDFVKMPLGRDERQGLRPGGEQEALRKLDRIMRIHRPLFAAIASFLLAGHALTIIEGNHDAEFFFDGVRGALRHELLRLASNQLRRQGIATHRSEEIASRIGFSNWFVAEAGHYHIEHGHQYDPFCAFEHKLMPLEAPLGVAADAVLTQPMSHRILPKIAELMGNFSTHGIHSLSLRNIGRLLWDLGAKKTIKLVMAYCALCVLLLRHAGGRRRHGLQQMAVHQARRLRVLCAESCYSAGVLRGLDTLKAVPAEYSLATMLHLFWVDRLLMVAFGLGVAALWLIFSATLLQAALCVGFSALCAALMSAWDPPAMHLVLRDAAANIAQVTGAQYVIFGHSHQPETINLHRHYGVGRAGVAPHYINSGSWVTREILRGESGQGMTYVQITAEGAQLLRWRGTSAAPVCLQDLRPAPQCAEHKDVPLGSAAG